jgi:hypothetical protein
MTGQGGHSYISERCNELWNCLSLWEYGTHICILSFYGKSTYASVDPQLDMETLPLWVLLFDFVGACITPASQCCLDQRSGVIGYVGQ